MSHPTRAVFFDLGGTLFSYRHVGRSGGPVLVEAARRLGIEAERRELGRAFGRAMRETFAGLAGRPYYLHADLFREALRRWADAHGRDAPVDLLEWFLVAQREAMLADIELRDDCLATLRSLRERGLYVSIVSNIDDADLHPIVARTGLSEVLDDWSSSEEARSCKPDPGFFRFALEKAGRRAEDVLFVGDSLEHDVAGARPLGMRTALIVETGVSAPGSGTPQEVEPHHRIEALAELLELV